MEQFLDRLDDISGDAIGMIALYIAPKVSVESSRSSSEYVKHRGDHPGMKLNKSDIHKHDSSRTQSVAKGRVLPHVPGKIDSQTCQIW